MEYVVGGLFLAWIVLRETKETCYFCSCKRKVKHLKNTLFGPACDDSCLHVAFITGKPVIRNGQLEVEYNWDRD